MSSKSSRQIASALLLMACSGLLGVSVFALQRQSSPVEGEFGAGVLVLHFKFEHAADVTGESLLPASDQRAAAVLGSSLLVQPGVHALGGRRYLLRNEGLYRFLDFQTGASRQFIVYRSDVPALLSALSWMVVHGVTDVHMPIARMVDEITKRKLHLDCGPVTELAVHVLKTQGIGARSVVFQTLEWDRESLFGNNHAMPEVNINGRWELFDVDNNLSFRQGGRRLAARDFIGRRVDIGKLRFETLATDAAFSDVDYNWGNRAGSARPHYSFGFDYMFNDIRPFYKRVLQVPIMHGAEFTGVNAAERQRVLDYPQDYRYIEPETFFARYYPRQGG